MIRLELAHAVQQCLKAVAQKVVADNHVRIVALYCRQKRVEQCTLRLDSLERRSLGFGACFEIRGELFDRSDDSVQG